MTPVRKASFPKAADDEYHAIKAWYAGRVYRAQGHSHMKAGVTPSPSKSNHMKADLTPKILTPLSAAAEDRPRRFRQGAAFASSQARFAPGGSASMCFANRATCHISWIERVWPKLGIPVKRMP